MDQFFQQVLNGLTLGGVYSLVALGLTLTYGTLQVPNFAHGHLYMWGAYLSYTLMSSVGFNYWAAMSVSIVTLAHEGCEVWRRGERLHVPGVPAAQVVDPTGCGDAFRGALLYGLEKGWSLERSVALGNRLGALKIAQRGPQHHGLDDAVRAELAR